MTPVSQDVAVTEECLYGAPQLAKHFIDQRCFAGDAIRKQAGFRSNRWCRKIPEGASSTTTAIGNKQCHFLRRLRIQIKKHKMPQ